MTVYINPNNPQDSVLEKGMTSGKYLALGIMVALLFIAIIVMLFVFLKELLNLIEKLD